MAHVVEINRIEDLAPYRNDWHRLLAQTRGASFFRTLEWLEIYWKYFGHDQKLRVLILEEAGTPIGIIPLVVRREPTRLGRVSVLTYPLHDWGTYYGPIGADGARLLGEALNHLAHHRRDFELLDLRFLDRADADDAAHALQAIGWSSREAVWKETAILDLTIGWEAYWASRESKFRNNLRRHEKRLKEMGEVELVRYRPRGAAAEDSDPRYDLFDACVDVARRSWQATSDSGTTLSHPEIHDYLRETHAAAAALGCVDISLIKLNGEYVAFGYNYVYDGSLLGLRVGYDAQYTKIGLGNLLYLYAFQDCFARQDKQFDMGIGSLDIKRFWWTQTACSYHLTHYPLAAPRAQLLRLKHLWTETHAAAT